MANLRILKPQSLSDLNHRDRMLQQCLRQSTDPFQISLEYPLLLSPESAATSFIGYVDQDMVAHANLWKRYLVSPTGTELIRIGIVANVATRSEWRRQGLCRDLMTYLINTARDQSLSALVLWSDLTQFYQKLGFESCSQEIRFTFQSNKLPALNLQQGHIALLKPAEIESFAYSQLLPLRPNHFWTIRRQPEEFRTQLYTPGTRLYHGVIDGEPCYAVIGRGCDLQGVIHEWGAKCPEHLAKLIHHVAHAQGLAEIMVLVPPQLDDLWLNSLTPLAKSSEIHPMAMMYNLSHNDLNQLRFETFIWGLDSA